MAAKTKAKAKSAGSSRKPRAATRALSPSNVSKRSVWKGAITFGLITIPIGLFTAVEERDIGFHQLAKDGSRIRYKRVSSKSGREVEYDDILRGYEYQKGRYVTFTDEELDRIPSESIKAIDIVNFVDSEQIDPLLFQKGYYVAPEEPGLKAYTLLTKALEKAGKVGIAKVTLREKERLATVRPKDGVLVLETMHWPDEIRVPDFSVLEKRTSIRPQEIKMAESLIDSLSGDFEPESFHDTYRERLEEAIEAKVKGDEVQFEEEAAQPEQITDLMEALRASLEATKGTRKKKSAGGETRKTASRREARKSA